MKRLKVGQKSQKIELYRPVTGRSPSGAQLPNSYERRGRFWASVLQRSGTESEVGDSLQGVSVYSIIIAWRDIKADWIVVWRESVLRVISVDDSDPWKRDKAVIAELDPGIKLEDLL